MAGSYISGTTNDDGIIGATDNDTLMGGAGADTISGLDGADNLLGGTGNDVLFGGTGADELRGDDGADSISGGDGNDTIIGGAGNDTVDGGDGNDYITETDQLTVSQGDLANGFFSTTGSWSLVPATGAAPTISGGYLRFNAANKATYGDYAQQTVQTTPGATYTLTVTANEEGSGTGNQNILIEIIDQNGTVIGTSGVVTLVNDAAAQSIPVTYTATTPGTTVRITNTGATNTVNSDLWVDSAVNSLVSPPPAPGAAGGDDSLSGGAGNDTIASGYGNDTLSGGTGNDDLRGEQGNDSLNAGDGNDTLRGEQGDDHLDAGAGNDVLNGGAGNDTGYGGSGDDYISDSDEPGTLFNPSFDISNGAGWTEINPTGGAGQNAAGVSFTWQTGVALLNSSDVQNNGDGIAQRVSTTIGAQYQITVNARENGAGNANHQLLIEAVDDNGTVIASTTVWVNNGQSANPTLSYTASTAGTTIRVTNPTSTGSNGSDLYIDAVNNVLTSSAPSTDSDLYYGGTGDDTIYGDNPDFPNSGGSDSLFGGEDNDAVYGGAGNDLVNGDGGNDSLYGGNGDDSIAGGGGNDTAYGADGNDTITDINSVGPEASGAVSDPTMQGFVSWTPLNPTGGTGPIQGASGGDDYIALNGLGEANYGDGIQQTVTTTAGSTYTLSVRAGEIGSGNADHTVLIEVLDENGIVIASRTEVVANGQLYANFDLTYIATGPATTIRITNPTSTGTVSTDLLIWNVTNTLAPVTYDDQFYGDLGNDLLDGAFGNDSLFGGADNDTLIGGAGNDNLSGGDGNDVVHGDDTAGAQSGNDSIQGGLGDDLIYGGLGTDTIYGDNASGDTTSGGADTIYGGDGNEAAYGGAGADLLNGEAGNDSLSGGTGNDTLDGGLGADSLDGGADNDLLLGGDNNDTLSGGTGADSLNGEAGADSLLGGAGNDILDGGLGADSLDGGADNDLLLGGDSNDSLSGGTGNDTLNGGAGADSLTGGAGNDVFIADGSADRITDFNLTNNADGNQLNNDFVDLSKYYNTITLAAWNTANPGQQYSDPLAWLRADQADGTLQQAGNFQIYNGASAVIPNGLTYDNTNVNARDGIVEGTQGADSIDAGYTGDPNGDRIDANDAILPGDGPNDDVVYGYNGNDTIVAGVGNDEVYGGHHNDVIYGGTGDDTLSGDGQSYTIPGAPGGTTQLVSNGTFSSNMNGWTTSIDPGNIGQTVNLAQGGLGFGNYPHFQSTWAFTQVNPAAGSSLNIQFQYSEWDGAGQQIANSGAYVTFSLRTNPYDPATAVPFTYLGNTVTSVFMDGNTNSWQTYALSVANTTGVPLYLYFDAQNSGNTNPVIDNVVVNSTSTASPAVTVNPIGDDLIYGEAGNDLIHGDGANDTLFGGADNDSLYGDAGNDVLNGDAGNDLLSGGDGTDSLTGGTGSDTLYGDAGNDLLSGGENDDVLFGGADSDTLHGNDGNDALNGDAGFDELYGDAGNDTLTGTSGDVLYGGADNDLLYAGGSSALAFGDAGNDEIFVSAGAFGYGGADEDTLYGSGAGTAALGDAGNDIIHLSAGAAGYGGDDRDTFYAGMGTNADGGDGGDDYDILDLTTLPPGAVSAVYGSKTLDADGNSYSGTINFLDSNGAVIGTMTFAEIEEVINVTCFTRGTMIATDLGEVAIEDLRQGDMILTRDEGFRPLRWIGRSRLGAMELSLKPQLRPIRIRAGALGHGLPTSDLVVSPQHRVLVSSVIAERMFGDREVLVAAKHLTEIDGIEIVEDGSAVEYWHFLLDEHQIVLSNGAATESLYTGPEALKAVSVESRREILELFPQLADLDHAALAQPARQLIPGRRARRLAERVARNGHGLFSHV